MGQFETKRQHAKCQVCGKDILVASSRGERSQGFCSKVCASMERYKKRFVGNRSERFSKPVDLEKYRHE